MSKAHPPELKKYMDKRLTLKLNAGRVVTGVLRGFDPFMNLVVDEAIEETKTGEKNQVGMVGSMLSLMGNLPYRASLLANLLATWQVIRGNSVVLLEALERIV